jgi:hypothetical protein
MSDRPCPNHSYCKRSRRRGEIFCHECYFRLPKEYRDMLWIKDWNALAKVMREALRWLQLDQGEGGV